MVFWNLLDGGPNRSGPLLEPFESIQGGAPGTNPRHNLTRLFRVLIWTYGTK
jgi:hypothetical protein